MTGAEPAVIAALVAAGAQAAGTVADIQSSNAEASQMRRKSTLQKLSALEEERQFRNQAEDMNAASRAKVGKSGVDMTGSVGKFLDRNIERQEMDALSIRYGGQIKQQETMFGAALAESQKTGKLFKGVGNIAGTALGASGKGGSGGKAS